MGLFDSETTVVVSSSLYSLSGEEAGRPNYLKTAMYGSTIFPGDNTTTDSIVNAYLRGPGVKYRGFFNWAVRNNFEGLPAHGIRNTSSVAPADVEPHIPVPAEPVGLVTTVQSALISEGDHSYFAEKYILDNTPLLINDPRVSEYDVDTHTITITYTGSSVTFAAGIYDPEKRFLIAYFTQKVPGDPAEPAQEMFIYEMGSGNASLDALTNEEAVSADFEFYPFIPIRINNKSITHATYVNNGFYDECDKAYTKCFSLRGSKGFSSIITTVEDNPDIAEIDYCYISYGIPLNCKENAGKKYIYTFLKGLIPFQDTTSAYMDAFFASIASHDAEQAEYDEWEAAQSNPADPLYETPAPTVSGTVPPKYSTLTIKNSGTNTSSYRVTIHWINIQEEFLPGLGKVGATIDEVWMEAGTTVNYSIMNFEVMYMYRQIDANTYSKLTCYGLLHRNYIYGSESVNYTTGPALVDVDESGFLIPLHDPTLRSMSLVDATQVTIQSGYLIFNTYQIYKKKWYEKGVFKIVIVVLIIVLAVFIAPVAVGASVGLLGTNLAVGTALGLTGLSAIIAGAVANTLAAMVLTSIIMSGSTALFGDRIGAIVGAIVSFVLVTGFTGGFDFSNFGSADSVMKLSDVLANSYQGWTNAEIQDIYAKMESNKTDYEKSLEELQKNLRDLGGYNDLYFNPIDLTDTNVSSTGNYLPESVDQFIYRTTLVGSDIVEITLSMIEDFPRLSLELPRN